MRTTAEIQIKFILMIIYFSVTVDIPLNRAEQASAPAAAVTVSVEFNQRFVLCVFLQLTSLCGKLSGF